MFHPRTLLSWVLGALNTNVTAPAHRAESLGKGAAFALSYSQYLDRHSCGYGYKSAYAVVFLSLALSFLALLSPCAAAEVSEFTLENSSASMQALQKLKEYESKHEGTAESAREEDENYTDLPAEGAHTSSALDSFFGTQSNAPGQSDKISDRAINDAASTSANAQQSSSAPVSMQPSFAQALERAIAPSSHEPPFTLSSRQQDNELILNFSLRGQSYIYKTSLSLTSLDKDLLFAVPMLPRATEHTDALGTSEVFFRQLQIKVPLLQGKSGDRLRLSYQGCDENGICYPPQRINITLTADVTKITAHESSASTSDAGTGAGAEASANAIKNGKSLWTATSMPSTLPETHERNASAANTASDADYEEQPWGSFDLITEESSYGNTLSKTIADNLLIGVLLCFVLGIGLDLTPCVLPMLPIFSAMLIGSSSSAGPKRWGAVLLQNSAYALGLTITYTILGLLMSLLGASLHSVLQSPVVLSIVAVLLIICALACAGVIEMQMPRSFTSKLQNRISRLNTHKFYGAFMLGALSALIASPCTSAPLAGALLYVLQNGNLWVGGLSFFAIGLGMATPLLIIGVFGSKFLQHYGFIGDLVKRILVVVLLCTAFYLVRHLLGRLELIISSLLVYIVILYTISTIVYYLCKRHIYMMLTLLLAVISLIPTYFAFGYLEKNLTQEDYAYFTDAHSVAELQKLTAEDYSFVVFTAKWCTNCKFMEKNIYSQPDFLDKTTNIKLVVVDITDAQRPETKELMEHYQIVGVPFYMTLLPQNKILHSQLGLTPKEQVMRSLKQLHERRYRDFLESNDASEHMVRNHASYLLNTH